MYGTIWALLPPVVAIVLALITKEVYSSLFIGIVTGALIYTGFSPIATLDTVINEGFINSVADAWNIGIFMFLILLGTMVALMNKAGGSAAFGEWAKKHVKTRAGALLSTFLLGVLIFVDDYFNCLTVGSVMMPVTDGHKISRAKLAYIIDATAAPICMIAPISSWAAAVSGMVDVAGGLAGIVLFSPVMLLAALAIKLDSPGPVIFRQTRVGKNGRTFQIYKFRSMYVDAEERKSELLSQNEIAGGVMFKIREDPRITRVGRILRNLSIDELPQFFNVLGGSMSLVGTRPPTPDEVEKYGTRQWRRISIKPGLTGMWQVNGRSLVTDFEKIVELDVEYIDNWSLMEDIRILCKTVTVLLKHADAY